MYMLGRLSGWFSRDYQTSIFTFVLCFRGFAEVAPEFSCSLEVLLGCTLVLGTGLASRKKSPGVSPHVLFVHYHPTKFIPSWDESGGLGLQLGSGELVHMQGCVRPWVQSAERDWSTDLHIELKTKQAFSQKRYDILRISFSRLFIYVLRSMSLCARRHAHATVAHMQVRVQLVEVGSLVQLCRFRGLNSGSQAWRQAPFPISWT